MADQKPQEQVQEDYGDLMERLQMRVAANRMAATKRSERQSLTKRLSRSSET
jgi:hypothetical protein